MHHTVLLLTQVLLPYISSTLRYVPHLSEAAGLHPSAPLLQPSITTYKQSVVASRQTNPALINMLLNHSLVYFWECWMGLFELAGSELCLAANQWIKSLWKVYLPNRGAVCVKQSVRSQKAKSHSLRRWVELSPALSQTEVSSLKFLPAYFFQFKWMQPLWQ